MTEYVDGDGYCDVTDRPLPEPPCGLDLPCPVHGAREPHRYAWVRDGLLVAGTLQDWVKMWEGDYYAGEYDDLTTQLMSWDGKNPPVMHTVRVKRGELSENDYIPYLISVPDTSETVWVNIDGRA